MAMILTKIEKDVQKSRVQGEEGEEAFYVNKYEDYLLTLGELAALKPGVELASLIAGQTRHVRSRGRGRGLVGGAST
jgi:hypothetical protein